MTNAKNIYKRYPSVQAVLKHSVSKEEGTRKYFQVKLTKEDGFLSASVIPAPKPPSAARSLSPMIQADGSFVMEEKTAAIEAGSIISVTLNDYEI
jgi:molybdopterin biosynthesis enzyme